MKLQYFLLFFPLFLFTSGVYAQESVQFVATSPPPATGRNTVSIQNQAFDATPSGKGTLTQLLQTMSVILNREENIAKRIQSRITKESAEGVGDISIRIDSLTQELNGTKKTLNELTLHPYYSAEDPKTAYQDYRVSLKSAIGQIHDILIKEKEILTEIKTIQSRGKVAK